MKASVANEGFASIQSFDDKAIPSPSVAKLLREHERNTKRRSTPLKPQRKNGRRRRTA